MKIYTIRQVTNKELSNLQNEADLIIPFGQVVLLQKFLKIIAFNIYLLDKPRAPLNLNEYCKETNETNLNISPTDISRLKKIISDYNLTINYELNKVVLGGDGIITMDDKLTLIYVHKYYTSFRHARTLKQENESFIRGEDIDFFSYVKIYDFYKNSDDKKALFQHDDIKRALGKIEANRIEIISIIDNLDIHNSLTELLENRQDIVKVKHISNTKSSYIPSLFFVLLKFKLKNSNNYKEYIFYLEEEINFGVASYAKPKTAAGQFYEMLEARFDAQFKNPANIDFSIREKECVFENSLQNIISDIKNLSQGTQDSFEEDVQNLKTKIISLKLHYPNMNYAYKLLGRLAKYVVSIVSISMETNNGKALENTAYLVDQMLEQQVNQSLDNVLDHIRTEQLFINRKVDLKKLRKSIFVNSLAYSEKSLCDVFDFLHWSSAKNILLSLQTIENSEEYLQEFFSYFNVASGSMPFKEMQDLFKGTVMEQIMNGEAISINNTSRLNII